MKPIQLPLNYVLEFDDSNDSGRMQGFLIAPGNKGSASLICARSTGCTENEKGEWSIPRAVMNEIQKEKYNCYE